MTSPLGTLLDAALAGAVRGAAREIGHHVHSGIARANVAINRARVPLRIAQAGLDAAQADLTSFAELAASALDEDVARNAPRR